MIPSRSRVEQYDAACPIDRAIGRKLIEVSLTDTGIRSGLVSYIFPLGIDDTSAVAPIVTVNAPGRSKLRFSCRFGSRGMTKKAAMMAMPGKCPVVPL